MPNPRPHSLTATAFPQSPDSLNSPNPADSHTPPFQPLPPLLPQLERYLGVKSPLNTPPKAKNFRHSTPLPPTGASYSATLYYPTAPPPPRKYPPYKPYYLVEDDSDMPQKRNQLRKTQPHGRSHSNGKTVSSGSESEIISPTNTVKSVVSESSSASNDRLRSFRVIPTKPVVGGDSVFRKPFGNIPEDNLSFALAESSFLPLGQGAPRNAMHATRFTNTVSKSKEDNEYNPKSIERGRVDSPPPMMDKRLSQYGETIRRSEECSNPEKRASVGTLSRLGNNLQGAFRRTPDVVGNGSKQKPQNDDRDNPGQGVASRDRSRTPGPDDMNILSAINAEGIAASKSCPNMKTEIFGQSAPPVPPFPAMRPVVEPNNMESKGTTSKGKKSRKKLDPGAWWQ